MLLWKFDRWDAIAAGWTVIRDTPWTGATKAVTDSQPFHGVPFPGSIVMQNTPVYWTFKPPAGGTPLDSYDALMRQLHVNDPNPDGVKLRYRDDNTSVTKFLDRAVCEDLAWGDPTGSYFVGRFRANAVPYSDTLNSQTTSVSPKYNLLTNPQFESVGSWSPTGWTGWGGAGTALNVAGLALLGRRCARLNNAYVQQTVTVTASTTYTVTFWARVETASGVITASGLDTLYANDATTTTAVPITLSSQSTKKDKWGYTWNRYQGTYTTGSAQTSLALRVGTTGGQALLDGVQLETGSTASPYHDKLLARSYVFLDTAGTALTDPVITLTPSVTPAGPERYRIPFTVRNQSGTAVNWPVNIVFTGAYGETQSPRTALLTSGNDLRVRDTQTGRIVRRWIVGSTTGSTIDGSHAATASDPNWSIWTERVHFRAHEEKQLQLEYGDLSAPDPARFGPPENLTVYGTHVGKGYYRAGRDLWYCVEAYSSTGRTLATSAVRIVIPEDDTDVALEWDPMPTATGYRVFRGTSSDRTKHRAVTVISSRRHTRFVDSGKTLLAGDTRPRVTGANPTSPYDLQKPLWDLAASTNNQWKWTSFMDPNARGRSGTWQPRRNARNDPELWVTTVGVTNRADAGLLRGDEWYLSLPWDITTVAGQLKVQTNPTKYVARLHTKARHGEWTLGYSGWDGIDPPSWFAHRQDKQAAGLSPTGYRNVKVTYSNATGETKSTAKQRVKITTTATGALQKVQVELEKKPGGAAADSANEKFNVYCSQDADPRLATSITTATIAGAYPYTVTVSTDGTGDVAPDASTAQTIYPSLTTLPAFSQAAVSNARDVRLWLEDMDPSSRAFRSPDGRVLYTQRYELGYVTVTADASQTLVCSDANALNVLEGAHANLRVRNRNTGHTMTVDLIDAQAGTDIRIDTEQKSISRDADGDPQLDALTLDSPRDRWLPLEPGVTNVLELTQYRTASPAYDPNVSVKVEWRDRG